MNQDIENIIKKNLPDEKIISNEEFNSIQEDYSGGLLEGEILGHNQCLSQIPVSLIADEVLKVVVENERQRIGQEMDLIWRDTHHDLNLFEQAICELQEDLLFNSNTLEGEQSEHLSTNKENKNND